jgi:hypothetical protein
MRGGRISKRCHNPSAGSGQSGADGDFEGVGPIVIIATILAEAGSAHHDLSDIELFDISRGPSSSYHFGVALQCEFDV